MNHVHVDNYRSDCKCIFHPHLMTAQEPKGGSTK